MLFAALQLPDSGNLLRRGRCDQELGSAAATSCSRGRCSSVQIATMMLATHTSHATARMPRAIPVSCSSNPRRVSRLFQSCPSLYWPVDPSMSMSWPARESAQ